MLRYLPFLLVLALWIYAFIDCLNTPEEEVKGLPKVVWVIIILLFGEVLVGPVAWLVAGRNRRGPAGGVGSSEGSRGQRARFVAPDDNPEFLNSLKAENRKDESGRDAGRRDETLLQDWEADLRRREEELKRREEQSRTDEES
ncbi:MULTISPECIES: PLD nuclease N-terminal domain-containing protein [unclassified Streptomyces]|uniref:PLD nuclease N-terminal domain-containing protein n=1 Tax=unclassified Streptomyces TaxID=2593676 RepID=UPI0013B80535|nr:MULTISPECIES: PLD nuclease N-terminal domain-containing protein [unclassified Streptomyces]MCX4916257.1 PLD nuclease N-terminal domain-containing protein [Streptomyces sp. NBC_00687]NEB28192.1 PLDc_N domain-containing protein [Streptomyces sp. SID14446]WSD78284.1 PLD nuclease N-terminal domain-containing protein [Streptomyces sp. NBC_01558]WSK61863.1 PLD nuclease N-terminal domain-containing protein [Streptomyces sp. NBC_01281]